jgi:hypothetical protein
LNGFVICNERNNMIPVPIVFDIPELMVIVQGKVSLIRNSNNPADVEIFDACSRSFRCSLFRGPIAEKKIPVRAWAQPPLIRRGQITEEVTAAAGSKLFHIDADSLPADYCSNAMGFMR